MRARNGYCANTRTIPQQAGEIVITLADLYGALQDIEGGAALLDGFLRTVDSRADPVTVAQARPDFCERGAVARSYGARGRAVDPGRGSWAKTSPNRYAEERLECLSLRAREQRAAGDLDGAISTMRDAIQQRLALSGRLDRETAVIYNSLAITLAAAHRLDEALDAYRESLAVYRDIGFGQELDAQIISGNIGGLEVRTGHLREAEPMLVDAIQHERELAGNSGAVASAMGAYGRLLALTDRLDRAVPTTVRPWPWPRSTADLKSFDRTEPVVSRRGAARGRGPGGGADHAHREL